MGNLLEAANKRHKEAQVALDEAKERVRNRMIQERGKPPICGICGQPLEIWPEGKQSIFGIPQECHCTRGLYKDVEEARKEALRQGKLNDLRREAFWDRRFESFRFDADDGANLALMSAAKRYAEQFEDWEREGGGLLLYGNVGTGKSFAACCIANALLDRGISCLFTSMSRLSNALFDSKDKNGFLDDLRKYRLLVIDDLSAERDSGFIAEATYNVINARNVSGKPMVITSNLTGEELKNREDRSKARVFDRILETCHPVEVKGKSRRAETLKANFELRNSLLGL